MTTLGEKDLSESVPKEPVFAHLAIQVSKQLANTEVICDFRQTNFRYIFSFVCLFSFESSFFSRGTCFPLYCFPGDCQCVLEYGCIKLTLFHLRWKIFFQNCENILKNIHLFLGRN